MIEIWIIAPFKITRNMCFSYKYCVLVTKLNELLWNFNKTKSDYESYTYVYDTYICMYMKVTIRKCFETIISYIIRNMIDRWLMIIAFQFNP